MPTFKVKLARAALEVACVEVKADSEVEAVNTAFKFIDRKEGGKVDPRVKATHIEIIRDERDNPWEEESVEQV